MLGGGGVEHRSARGAVLRVLADGSVGPSPDHGRPARHRIAADGNAIRRELGWDTLAGWCFAPAPPAERIPALAHASPPTQRRNDGHGRPAGYAPPSGVSRCVMALSSPASRSAHCRLNRPRQTRPGNAARSCSGEITPRRRGGPWPAHLASGRAARRRGPTGCPGRRLLRERSPIWWGEGSRCAGVTAREAPVCPIRPRLG